MDLARVLAHPAEGRAAALSVAGIKDAARLIHRALQASGVPEPRVAVAAFNPHGGDGGTCGREEVDIIAPAVRELNQEGLPVQGPFPADTIFLKAQAGEFQAIVTMYHDQGQIAIKLLGFSRGVTVQGGLPIPITTPAHGTAYDIAGQGRASDAAMWQAFNVACRMVVRTARRAPPGLNRYPDIPARSARRSPRLRNPLMKIKPCAPASTNGPARPCRRKAISAPTPWTCCIRRRKP